MQRGKYGNKDEGNAKEAKLNLRVTEEVKSELLRMAQGEGVAVSVIARRLLVKAMDNDYGITEA